MPIYIESWLLILSSLVKIKIIMIKNKNKILNLNPEFKNKLELRIIRNKVIGNFS